MALFAGKLHKEIDALTEQRALDQTIIEGMIAEQKRIMEAQNVAILNLRERHEAERKNWNDAMAAKEHIWELERERLKGMAEANKDKADLYDAMVKPFAWEWNGSVEINPGKKVDALVSRRDDPHQSWRLPYPEGRRP